MRKDRLSYMLVDASVNGYSASRAGSLVILLVDTLWVIAVIIGLPPEKSFVPISSMLGICTGAIWASYAGSSFARTWKQTGVDIASTVFKKTTTDEEKTTVTKPPARPQGG